MINHSKPFATIGAHVPRELYERLDEYCWSVRRRQSEVIREAVKRYLDAEQQPTAQQPDQERKP